MKARAPARRLGDRRRPQRLPAQVAQAVRSSLNLPTLSVEVRRGPERGVWQVRLNHGHGRSEWLRLNAGAVAVIKKVTLLPPKLNGRFRLAYDAVKHKEFGVGSQE